MILISKIFLFVLTLPFLSYGIDSSINSLKKIEGFESCFFSSKTGYPYLKIKYTDISTVKPKLGFLKFGIAFLKIEDLHLSLDLKEANSNALFSKWNVLANQKAIKYATMEPISVSLKYLYGYIISLKANKGKFSSDGGLKLWGKVECKVNSKISKISELTVYFNPESDSLVIIKGKDVANPVVLPFDKE